MFALSAAAGKVSCEAICEDVRDDLDAIFDLDLYQLLLSAVYDSSPF